MDYSKKNSLKVSLENFQSISNGNLEFVQGINIIVGQSNSGKSAILRAIKGAILNPNTSQKYIKQGTNGFTVGIDYDDNHIEWSRANKKSPQYSINGEEYKKVGNSDLSQLLDKNGFVLDEKGNLMNLEGELELPFPFDKNNSELFKLFEKNIFCVSDSTSVNKLIKADEDDTNRQLDNARSELDRFNSKLNAIKDLEQFVDMNKLVDGRNKLGLSINNKNKLMLDISDLCAKIDIEKILSKQVMLPSVRNSVIEEYNVLCNDIKALEKIKGVGKVLKPLPTASTLVVDVNGYSVLKNDIDTLEKLSNTMSILNPLEASATKVNMEEYTSLSNDINTLQRLSEQAQNYLKQLTDIRNNIKRIEEEKKTFKVCPLCGGELGNG